MTFLFQACTAARRECEIPFTGRCDRLHPSESFVWRRGQVSESCMDSLSVSVYKCPASCSCIQLSPSLFISLKFVQDCHQLSEFQEFFYFCFWKNPSWYVTGIYWMGYTLVTVHEFYLWWSDTFIFIIYFNYTCSIYTNLLVIFWSACSDEFYFCFACFKSSHWMSF